MTTSSLEENINRFQLPDVTLPNVKMPASMLGITEFLRNHSRALLAAAGIAFGSIVPTLDENQKNECIKGIQEYVYFGMKNSVPALTAWDGVEWVYNASEPEKKIPKRMATIIKSPAFINFCNHQDPENQKTIFDLLMELGDDGTHQHKRDIQTIQDVCSNPDSASKQKFQKALTRIKTSIEMNNKGGLGKLHPYQLLNALINLF